MTRDRDYVEMFADLSRQCGIVKPLVLIPCNTMHSAQRCVRNLGKGISMSVLTQELLECPLDKEYESLFVRHGNEEIAVKMPRDFFKVAIDEIRRHMFEGFHRCSNIEAALSGQRH